MQLMPESPTDTRQRRITRREARQDVLVAGVLCLAHVALAYYYRLRIDLEIVNLWPGVMQALPTEALRTHLLESLWHLHAQPPLLNFLIGILAKIFGDDYVHALVHLQVWMGASTVGITYLIGVRLSRSRIVAGLVAVVYVLLNPGIILLELVTYYSIMTTFFLALGALCVLVYVERKQPAALIAFVLCLNLAILSRSLYHLVILVPVVALAVILAETRWRRVLVLSAAVCLLSLGWYAKNWLVFDMFGASSWGGSNLWNIVNVRYSDADLQAFAAEGVIDQVVADLPPFAQTSDYEAYGFDQTSDVDVLSRDNYNNINIIAISRAYGDSSLALIRHEPLHYLKNVYGSYKIFADPVCHYLYSHANAARMDDHCTINARWFWGQPLTDQLNKLVHEDFTSPFLFVFPITLLVYAAHLLISYRFSLAAWLAYIRREPVLIYAGMIVVYTVAVSCLVEYGENNRFRVVIAPLLWPLVAALLVRGIRLSRSKIPRRYNRIKHLKGD
ncbi:MAG: glycosyltransferase family 39 protein [Anaerolineae bacterium]|nr:glycosyltransferase family 39 protein [Anaerolineae bacterium]